MAYTQTVQGKLRSYLCLGLVLLAILLSAAIRYRLRAMPLERDEGDRKSVV